MANCTDCNKHMKPIFQDGNDYFYMTCDTCLSDCCPDCCEHDDDTGETKCNNCMMQDALKKHDIHV